MDTNFEEDVKNVLNEYKSCVLCKYYQKKIAASVTELLNKHGQESLIKILSVCKPQKSVKYCNIFSSLVHTSLFITIKSPPNLTIFLLKELTYLLKTETEYTDNFLFLLIRIIKQHKKDSCYFPEETLVDLLQNLITLSLTHSNKTKSLVYKTSSMLINILPERCFYSHFSLDYIPLSGFETKDVIKRYSSQYFKQNHELLVLKLLYLYSNNTLKHDGGIILEQCLKHYTWCEFESDILALLFSIAQDQADSTFENSIIKYFIPKVSTEFPEEFYDFFCKNNALPLYKIQLHNCLNRRKNKKNPLEMLSAEEISEYLSNEKLSFNTIEMLITSVEFNPLVKWEITLIQIIINFMENSLHDIFNSSTKLLIEFVSKLFLKVDLHTWNKYYLDIFLLVFNCAVTSLSRKNISRGALIVEIIWRASNRKSFLKNVKEFYWAVTINGDFLKNLLLDNASNINGALYNLIKLRYPEEWKKINFMSLTDLYNVCSQNICLEVIEDFKVFCQLPLSDEDVVIYKRGYFNNVKNIQTGDLSKSCLMDTVLCLQVLIVSKLVDLELAETGLDYLLTSIPIFKKDTFDNVTTKLYERLIIDTLLFLDINMESGLLNNYKTIFIKVYQIIGTCNLRRPTDAAIGTIKKISCFTEHNILLKKEIIELVLNTLKKSPRAEQLMLGIRRNPQTSYVLHSLCLPINKNFGPINLVMKCLFQIVCNTQSLINLNYVYNCFQVLMADSVFHYCTEKYIQPLLKCCLKHFNNGFLVRIAVTSLFAVLVKRIFGSGPPYNKQHTLQEVYYKYENIINYLVNSFNPNDPNKTLIISFFEQSCSREYPFNNVKLKTILQVYNEKMKLYLIKYKFRDTNLKLATYRAFITVFKDSELEQLYLKSTDLCNNVLRGVLLERQLSCYSNFNRNVLNNIVIKNGSPATVLFLFNNSCFIQFVWLMNAILEYPEVFLKYCSNSHSIITRLSKHKSCTECKKIITTLIEQYFTTALCDYDLKSYSLFLLHLFQRCDLFDLEFKLDVLSLLKNKNCDKEMAKKFILTLLLVKQVSNLPEEHKLFKFLTEKTEVLVQLVFSYIIKYLVNFNEEIPSIVGLMLYFLPTLAFQFKFRLNVMKVVFLILVNPTVTDYLHENIITVFNSLFSLQVESIAEALNLIFSKDTCLNYVDNEMYVEYICFCERFIIDSIPNNLYENSNFYVSKNIMNKEYFLNILRLHKKLSKSTAITNS